MTLDSHRREYCFVYPILQASGHDPVSVRRIRQKTQVRRIALVSTRMKHVSTKSIDYYFPSSSPTFPPALSHLRLIVALRLFPTPSYCALSSLCWLLKEIHINNHRNVICTTQWRLNDRCSCMNTRKSTPLAGKMRYLRVTHLCRKEDTKVERVCYGQGCFVETKISLFLSIIVRPPWIRRLK